MPGNGHIQFPFPAFTLREGRGFSTKFLEYSRRSYRLQTPDGSGRYNDRL